MVSQYTMKVFLFGILLALGACVNGKPAPAELADVGVVDCDALEIVMRDLVSLNKKAKEKAEEADEEAKITMKTSPRITMMTMRMSPRMARAISKMSTIWTVVWLFA